MSLNPKTKPQSTMLSSNSANELINNAIETTIIQGNIEA